MATRPRLLPGDTQELRKSRGAFFTPWAIADFTAAWAVGRDPDAAVLDPTSGEGVFLLAAAEHLKALGASKADLARQVHGVDLHAPSLDEAASLLAGADAAAHLVHGDFFEQPTPDQLHGQVPWVDAVIGNPPFVRYHQHRGKTRTRSAKAALNQGVRLSGLASSWAALLVHACSFLKPEGRVAMVLPAELLTVGYAEPIRRWLTQRFAAVQLVLFEQLQFADAEEQVVLLIARGSGGCEALTLHQVRDADDLMRRHVFDAEAVAVGRPEDKWTDLLLPLERRSQFHGVTKHHFSPLGSYGQPALGTVTGANKFFTLTEPTRKRYAIDTRQLKKIVPPGSRHVPGTRFSQGDWQQLKADMQRVWLLHPSTKQPTGGLAEYIKVGLKDGIDEAYKCTVRTPWWKPPAVAPPDLFFTYMSHITPRLTTNDADATIVNSLHGIRLGPDTPTWVRDALPLAAFNSATMLGAELQGRSYGGGILKMEPREAATLPVPSLDVLQEAWAHLEPQRTQLDDLVRAGQWAHAVTEVDRIVLHEVAGMSSGEVAAMRADATRFRRRRTRQTEQ